jgi:hypothetical protein
MRWRGPAEAIADALANADCNGAATTPRGVGRATLDVEAAWRAGGSARAFGTTARGAGRVEAVCEILGALACRAGAP